MPHTRSKRAKAAAQAAATSKPVHTKRIQIEDEEGWTHVIDTPRKARAVTTEKETFLVGDFEKDGVQYVNRTIEEYTKDLSVHTKAWEGGQGAQLREKFLGIRKEGRRDVKGIVCLGLGSLQSARREGRRASWTQLVALRSMIALLGTVEVLPCIFQDPQFSDLDKEYLTSLGYTIVNDPDAFSKITEQSLVYAIHCYADIYKKVSEGPRPAVLVGTDVENFGRFNTSDKANIIARSLRETVKDCEEIDFPQVRHDFSDTKIYWRKAADDTIVIEPAEETPITGDGVKVEGVDAAKE